jgi:hypothetical protein
MASWLQHPRYVPIREGLIAHLRQEKYRFRSLDPVVFLCGGAGSKSRDALRNYLKRHNNNLGVFYAERVWDTIASLDQRDALQMESDLANLADLVIVIVESPGTFTELGAFSLSPPLRKKLLPIVEERYKQEPSFISTGPLRWIDKESDFRPTIYTPLSVILQAAEQIQDRISRIAKSRSTKLSDLSTSPKHLLFFICDLVAVIYPATVKMISHYLAEIAPSVFTSDINIPTLIGLGIAMKLLRSYTAESGDQPETYFAPAENTGASRPYHHGPFLYLEAQRAKHASVLLAIPQAKAALDIFREHL